MPRSGRLPDDEPRRQRRVRRWRSGFLQGDEQALGPDPEYDHNWCLRSDGSPLHKAAEVVDPGSGRRLLVSTTEPGVQVYTGGHLDDSVFGKSGAHYRPYAGLTFETQKFPDSPHHGHFPSSLVAAGELYRHVMVLELSTV